MERILCDLQCEAFFQHLIKFAQPYDFCQAGAERKVTFDWGPDGSKAEDCFFGIVALDQGYTFDFIDGEMHEKSPFTFQDFFKQRKRWMQGIYMVCRYDQWTTTEKMSLEIFLFYIIIQKLAKTCLF